MTSILRYDAACAAIAEAKTVDEVTDWVDKAAAVREYGRRINNRQIEIDAIEIRVKAKRRRGEILAELKENGRLVRSIAGSRGGPRCRLYHSAFIGTIAEKIMTLVRFITCCLVSLVPFRSTVMADSWTCPSFMVSL